ncbi:hypothetical protein EQV77_14355 [Halobacillus fulvus]|nr:hypothetical protein EQV77_14355 [Halobacillus fulvus]
MREVEPKLLKPLVAGFQLEKTLTKYIVSQHNFLYCQKAADLDASVGKTTFTLLRQINELQKILNQKIMLYRDRFSEADVYAVYCEHPDYEGLNDGTFVDRIEDMCELSTKCAIKEWNKSQIRNEAKQACFLFRERRKWLEIYKTIHNETKTVWLAQRHH